MLNTRKAAFSLPSLVSCLTSPVLVKSTQMTNSNSFLTYGKP